MAGRKNQRGVIGPITVLVSICLVASMLLAVTHQVTMHQVEQNRIEKAARAMAAVMPEADSFSPAEELELMEGIKAVHIADNGTGYVITSEAKTSDGTITVMTALDHDGKVLRSRITEPSGATFTQPPAGSALEKALQNCENLARIQFQEIKDKLAAPVSRAVYRPETSGSEAMAAEVSRQAAAYGKEVRV